MKKIPDLITVIETMATHREKYAKTVFAYEEIKAEIIGAACKGMAYIRVSQTLAADLSRTKACTLLVQHLKEDGYMVEWVTAVQRERSGGQETGAFIQFREMRISWGQIKIHSGPQVETA